MLAIQEKGEMFNKPISKEEILNVNTTSTGLKIETTSNVLLIDDSDAKLIIQAVKKDPGKLMKLLK